MSDPKRLLENDQLSVPMTRLRAGLAPRPMTGAEMSRSVKHVARVAAFPLLTGFFLSIKSVAMASLAGAAVGVVVIGASVWIQDNREPLSTLPSTTTAIAPAKSLPVVVPPAISVAPQPEASTSASTRQAASAPFPAESIAEEAAMLEEARTMLASNPARALDRLEQHAAKFPRAKLAMERELLMVDALRRTGRQSEAQRRARSLIQASPDSLYAKQLRQMIEAPSPDAGSNVDLSKEPSP